MLVLHAVQRGCRTTGLLPLRKVAIGTCAQELHEQVECLRAKLGQAGEAHRLVRQECAREMAAARVAWDLRRRKELQVTGA